MPVQPSLPESDRPGVPSHRAALPKPSVQRLGRRAFLALAAGGFLLTGCQPREQIVYVDSRVPTSTPPPPPTPTLSPTAPPAPAQGQGPIALPPPAPVVPIGGVTAQSQVIPALKMRPHAYTPLLQPPDRLQIPSIDLDSKVVQIATKIDPRGAVLWETAAFAVGYHRGSGLPGENGNVVLSGHISSPREGAVFHNLPKVQPGDGVIVATPDRQHLYVVAEIKTVTPDAVEVLDPSDHAILTMITCVPDGVYSHRLVVRAEAV